MTTAEWDIKPRSNACSQCQQTFADKQTYHTLLSIAPAGYQPADLCETCYARAGRAAAFSYWQAEFRVPPPPPPEAIQKDTAETLLRKLIESKEPVDEAPRYILAVMLERKRLLKHRDTIHEENGREVLVYEHAITGETLMVADPHLHLDQLEQVQQQVSELLGAKPAVKSVVS